MNGFMRAGVGKALAFAIVETARRAGFKTMRLDTSCQVGSPSLYERIGFETHGPLLRTSRGHEGMAGIHGKNYKRPGVLLA